MSAANTVRDSAHWSEAERRCEAARLSRRMPSLSPLTCTKYPSMACHSKCRSELHTSRPQGP
eukprot:scaffold57959_cov69-Phaeocystis_antarctica.AAC.5